MIDSTYEDKKLLRENEVKNSERERIIEEKRKQTES